MILIIILIVLPMLISELAFPKTENLKLGIILTEGCDEKFSDYAREGLERIYGDYVSVEQLDYRLNMTDIETRYDGRQYSTDSINSKPGLKALKTEQGLDVILIITQYDISSWEDINWAFLFGKASFEDGTCVMSVYRFTNGTAPESNSTVPQIAPSPTIENRLQDRVQSIVVHEVGHLFGYTHCRYDCVMLFGESIEAVDEASDELCWVDQIELRYRTSLSQNFYGNNFTTGMFILEGLIALIYIPYLFAIFFIIEMVFEKHLYRNLKPGIAVIPIVFLTTFFVLMFTDPFWAVGSLILVISLFYLIKLDANLNNNLKLDKRKPGLFIGYMLIALLLGAGAASIAMDYIGNLLPSPAFVIITGVLVLDTFYLLEINDSLITTKGETHKKYLNDFHNNLSIYSLFALMLGVMTGIFFLNFTYMIIVIFLLISLFLIVKLYKFGQEKT